MKAGTTEPRRTERGTAQRSTSHGRDPDGARVAGSFRKSRLTPGQWARAAQARHVAAMMERVGPKSERASRTGRGK